MMRVATFAIAMVLLPALRSSPAFADPVEGSAIASLIETGRANAPTHFTALRGDLAKHNDRTTSYRATTLPDDSHYSSCFVYFVKPDPSSDARTWIYTCNSTPRIGKPDRLFEQIEPLVRSNLPACYSSSGPQVMISSSITNYPWESWKCTGSPDIILEVFADKDAARTTRSQCVSRRYDPGP